MNNRVKSEVLNDLVRYSHFSNPMRSGADEYFIGIYSDDSMSFKEALDSIYGNYLAALKTLGLSDGSQIFTRLFVSDIANQKNEIEHSAIYKFLGRGAFSIGQQVPLNSGPISLFAYHVAGQTVGKKKIFHVGSGWGNGVRLEGANYDIFWTANLSTITKTSALEQSDDVLDVYNSFINDNGLTLLGSAVRTWIYIRDIDNNYQGLVDARTQYFELQGLTPKTRYIASTGIEALFKDVNSLVSLDALNVTNLDAKQIIRMEAPDHMCPTHNYKVTFERGTKIEFGDRRHLYISGTASIDKNGAVLYPSDVTRQTERAFENIDALLCPHGADINDFAYLVVYVRNIKEAKRVMAVIESRVKNPIPIFVVHAPVCRPSWLVEIEGVGVTPCSTEFKDFI